MHGRPRVCGKCPRRGSGGGVSLWFPIIETWIPSLGCRCGIAAAVVATEATTRGKVLFCDYTPLCLRRMASGEVVLGFARCDLVMIPGRPAREGSREMVDNI